MGWPCRVRPVRSRLLDDTDSRRHQEILALMSTASTSLNLRALLKTAIARSGLDTRTHAVAGLTPAAKALFVAGASHERQQGLVLYVVPGDGDLEQATGDVKFFLASLDGLSASEIG